MKDRDKIIEKAVTEIIGDKLSKEDRIIPEHYVRVTFEWLQSQQEYTLLYSGSVSEKDITKFKRILWKLDRGEIADVFDREFLSDMLKNLQSYPTPEISEEEIESIIALYEDFKAKEKGCDGVEITAGNRAYIKLMAKKIIPKCRF